MKINLTTLGLSALFMIALGGAWIGSLDAYYSMVRDSPVPAAMLEGPSELMRTAVAVLCVALVLYAYGLAEQKFYRAAPIEVPDDTLGYLREARACLNDEKARGGGSREMSVTLTAIDDAILWRQEDLRMKAPVRNETNSAT